jgi:hypothetical protein
VLLNNTTQLFKEWRTTGTWHTNIYDTRDWCFEWKLNEWDYIELQVRNAQTSSSTTTTPSDTLFTIRKIA